MLALAAALFTAALALVGKIGFDVWTRYRERRGVAGALAGELGAYFDIVNPEVTPSTYRGIAALAREQRQERFRAYPPLPTSHPVFDKVAEKTGILPHQAAVGISRAYNAVTGMRLLLSSMSAQGFIDAPDEVQQSRLLFVADMIEREGRAALKVVGLLHRISRQSFWCFIGRCDPQLDTAGGLTPDGTCQRLWYNRVWNLGLDSRVGCAALNGARRPALWCDTSCRKS